MPPLSSEMALTPSADFAAAQPVIKVENVTRTFVVADVQTKLFEGYQQANERWLNRVQAEASLASEFVSKLSSARSIPDAMTAYQTWGHPPV
jgi:hypothetical protein